ncbi:hypothetical protein EZ428_20110 [Pedobacter frigiditerrae]|uniref:Uncharacterized protein n=1 Tax=Pedobacter frigiditerrae TaxID=2530452 RepID=A0A4R0MMQ8_9SPHI|nr:hypothetical protein [Pedobacter frigiditerrae]TCC88029.1 hypothetical protein EZ428_20110 [Pedobacter frigiditerrae]
MLYFNANQQATVEGINSTALCYFFESANFYLLETDANKFNIENLSKDQRWLMIDKSTTKVCPLNLRHKDASEVVEERFFEEGYLKFNDTSGTYIEKYNSAQHSLTQIPAVAIPAAVHEAVADFMS